MTTEVETETVADRENFDGYLFEGNSELVTANHRVAGLTETLAKDRAWGRQGSGYRKFESAPWEVTK